MKYTVEYIKKVQQLMYELDMLSLDQMVSTDDEPEDRRSTLLNLVKDDTNYENVVISKFTTAEICKYLEQLKPRESAIIKYRYGFIDGEHHTLQETGNAYSITRERTRQIERSALRKLRILFKQNNINSRNDI